MYLFPYFRYKAIWTRPPPPPPKMIPVYPRKPDPPKVYTIGQTIEYDVLLEGDEKLHRYPSDESFYTDYDEKPQLVRRHTFPAPKQHLPAEDNYQLPRYRQLMSYNPRPVVPVPPKYDLIPPSYDIYVPLSSLEPRILVHTDREQWMPIVGPGLGARTQPLYRKY